MEIEALGIDVGNVIINHRAVDSEDKTLYEEHYSTIQAEEGVFKAIKKLNDEKFNGNIFLISKGTPWAQEKIQSWLKNNDFYVKTGVKSENVLFCTERHEKNNICKDKGITHFIDDRLEVLGYMIGTVPNLFLYRPDQEEITANKEFLPKVTTVKNWTEVLERIK